MSAGIIILVIVLILLLIGLGVGLYFAFRKTKGPTGGTGPTGISPGSTGFFPLQPIGGFTPTQPINSGGFTGLQPIGGGTNPPVPTQPVSGSFSVVPDPSNGSFQGVWSISNNQLVVQPTDASQPCNNYRFRHDNISNPDIKGALIWQGDGKSVLYGNDINSPIQLVDPTNTTVPFLQAGASWTYDPERKIWHHSKLSNYIMQSRERNGEGVVRLENLSGDLDPGNAEWINGSVPNNNLPCINK